MKYYIFPFSSDAHAISALESSGRFEYKISSQNTTNAFAKLCVGDILVGYCIGTQQGASYILKIKEVLPGDQVEAEKIFEIGNVQIVNLKYSTLPPNIVYEIDEDSYHELLNEFFSVMLPARDEEDNDIVSVPEESPLSLPDEPKNLIYFGAPGTGKSHQLKKDSEIFGKNIERVTFYPNYSYAQFVGTYKPVMKPKSDDSGEEEITYAYVPGPFIRQWIKAKATNEPVLLIIEELNRANAAAVFGDMFQLLDRKNGESEYPVATSEDLRKYLKSIIDSDNASAEEIKQKGFLPKDTTVDEIAIPANMYIWTTMNSADQGVFPLDTAFKRRWDYKYFSVFDKKKCGEDNIDSKTVILHGKEYEWGAVREKINEFLVKKNVNEDKLIGPYFISETVFADNAQFVDAFCNKIIMYLFEDAARQYRKDTFQLNDSKSPLVYSQICKQFKESGFSIFKFDIPAENQEMPAVEGSNE